MAKLTLSSIIFAVIMLVGNNILFAQSDPKSEITPKKTLKTTLTFDLLKKNGIGPSGSISTIIGGFDPNDKSNEMKGFPKMKNTPRGLHDEVAYFYTLNDFQFHYQNYCAGVVTKDYFLEKAKEQKWSLADTVKLSRIAIKCGFSVLAGYNDANEMVYIVDTDGDQDFGNDVLKALLKQTYRNQADGAVQVLIEYISGKEIKQEKILVSINDGNRPGKEKTTIGLSFSFPEFRYAKFTYKGQPYLVCTDGVNMERKFIYVIPDEPIFDRVSQEKKVGLNQFIRIGDDDLIFTGYEGNGSKIYITVNNPEDFAFNGQSSTPKGPKMKPTQNNTIFSSQAGYKAPEIKGYNINTSYVKDLSFVSTADLKGKYIFLDFWSTFCGPCIAEFPYLKESYLKYDRKRFEIIGILDERDPSVTAKLFKEGNLIWPTIKMNTKGTDMNGYNIGSYPTSYLIDPQGTIIAVDLRGEELANKLKTLIK